METLFYLLKSAGVLSLFYIVYVAFLKRETLFIANRHFLLIGILAAALFPLLEFTKTILLEVPAFEPSQISGITSLPNEQATFAGQPHNPFFSFERILLAIYCTGVFILLLRFIYQLFILLFLLKKYPVQKAKGFKLIKVPEAISPFSFFNYIIYNPQMHAEGDLEMILKHEKVHIRQQHSIDVLISNLLIIVQWFNPLAWLYKKIIEENLEFIADHHAAKICSKKEYQLALVKTSSATTLPALTNYFYKSFIKKRIIMLNKTHSKKRNALKTIMVLPLLAIFLWSFNVKEVTKFVEIPSKKSKAETANLKKEDVKEVVSEEKKTVAEIVPSMKNEGLKKNEVLVQDKFRVNINKNTTDAKLKEIKEDLKTNYGIDLNYSAVRNSEDEIISLSMSYSGNGTNGNYQVSDDDGIDEFYFFVDDDGKTGFWSEAVEKRRKERIEERKVIMEERNNQMEDRHREMEQRQIEREQREAKMEQRHVEMEQRIQERKTEMEERQDEMEGRAAERDKYVVVRSGSGSNGVAVVSGSNNTVIINKNTTDAELAQLKKEFAAKNIDFNYKGVKRNSAGEITDLKITMDDHKGSKTSTSVKSDDGKPIDQVIINQ